MILAFSKLLDKAQKNYSAADKELPAVIKSIVHFRHYFGGGGTFILRTDHKALEYLWTAKNLTSRLLRWPMKLSGYCFTLEYIKDELNIADGLSRQDDLEIQRIILGVLSDEDKNKILEDYQMESGHGSKNTMKILINQ